MNKSGVMVNPFKAVQQAATGAVKEAVQCRVPARLLLAIFGIMLCFIQAEVWATTFVCINLDGKKIFSTIDCEKRGLKTGSADFPVIESPAQPTQSAQPVFILTPESEAQADKRVAIPAPNSNTSDSSHVNGNQVVKKNPRPNIWNQPLKIGGPGLVILIVMPIAASFFLGYSVLLYFRRRKIKLQDLDPYAPKV